MTMLPQNKRKVLYFVPEFPRLTETFIEREISKLIEFDNLNVAVLSLSKATGAMGKHVEDVTYFQRLTKKDVVNAFFSYVLLKPLKVIQAHSLIWQHDQVPYILPKKSKNTATKVVDEISVVGSFQRTRFVQFLKGLAYAKLFEKHQPDHIHCHFLSEPSTIVMVASHMLGISYSVSAHAKDIWVNNTLVNSKAKTAKFITICNKHAYERVLSLVDKQYHSRVHLIFHGVPADKLFTDPPKHPRLPVPMIFSVVSRFVEKKGIKYLIESARILKEQGREFKMVLVGAKNPFNTHYEDMLDLISEYDLQNYVEIKGDGKGLPNTEVAELYKIADIFALPNVTTTEGDVDGVPTVTIEAALAGLPIVTTDAGSVSDLIDEDSGLLVPQRDSKALALAIAKFIDNPSLGKSLSSTAKARAEEMFDMHRNIKALEELLLR